MLSFMRTVPLTDQGSCMISVFIRRAIIRKVMDTGQLAGISWPQMAPRSQAS